MKQLEMKHLSPYLPYGLQLYDSYDDMNVSLRGLILDDTEPVKVSKFFHLIKSRKMDEIKPILRPLSDLIKEININGETMAPCDYFEYGDENQDEIFRNASRDLETIGKYNLHHDIQFQPNGVIEKLFEWKFDIFGLIDHNLAIDVNTLQENPYA